MCLLRLLCAGTSTDAFHIDAALGIITVSGNVTLDADVPNGEAAVVHTLLVGATDGGSPPRRTTLTVLVHVLDVNDNAPVFLFPADAPPGTNSYNTSVSEAVVTGQEFFVVVAVDRDSGANGMVAYSMGSEGEGDTGEVAAMFAVDAVTGVLSTRAPLDRETTAEYRLLVVASDGGLPALSAVVIVTIRITDVNDNRPSFPDGPRNVDLDRRRQPGDTVTVVSAVDPDETPALLYLLLGQAPISGYFKARHTAFRDELFARFFLVFWFFPIILDSSLTWSRLVAGAPPGETCFVIG